MIAKPIPRPGGWTSPEPVQEIGGGGEDGAAVLAWLAFVIWLCAISG